MLSEDKDFEYYRNRCNVLEQLVNRFGEENKLLREKSNRLEEENRQLREELVAIKETVSALVARNINAKPDKPHNDSTAKKKRSQSNHTRKSRNIHANPGHTIQVD